MSGPEFVGMMTLMAMGFALVFPVVRAWSKRIEARAKTPVLNAGSDPRLERMEQAIDAIAVEVERIAEGQRFVTRLMTDRSPERVALPLSANDRNS